MSDKKRRSFDLYGDDEIDVPVAKVSKTDGEEITESQRGKKDLQTPNSNGANSVVTPASIATDKQQPTTASCSVVGDVIIMTKGYHASKKGERIDMQDAYVILNDYAIHFKERNIAGEINRLAYYAVFDGHNGPKAAEFAAKQLHKDIASTLAVSSLQAAEQGMKRCLVDSYKGCDDAFLSLAAKVKPVLKDGCTATTVLILNNTLFIANLGDSKAMLCRYKEDQRKEIALTLTKDHSPQVFEERMRIQKTGATVRDGRILGILEVSRSIGDGQYKKHGVICTPDVKKCSLTQNDRYVIIACDGLWKVFKNQEVLDFVAKNLDLLAKNDALMATEEKSLEQIVWENVCARLCAEAVKKGCEDNVTVVAVVISPPS